MEDAIGQFSGLLEDLLRVLGADHPDTLTTRSNLAICLVESDRVEDAIRQFEELLEGRLRALGADHPDTLETRSDLAFWLTKSGRVDEADALLRKFGPPDERVGSGAESRSAASGTGGLQGGGMMSDAVAVTQQRIQRMLTEMFGSVELTPGGGMWVTHESTAAMVTVHEFLEHAAVKVTAPMLRQVPLTDELCRWVAIEGQNRWFVRARLYVDDDARTCSLCIEADVLGDTIDPDEFKVAVTSVLVGANNLDDELQQRFGGLRWVDSDD